MKDFLTQVLRPIWDNMDSLSFSSVATAQILVDIHDV